MRLLTKLELDKLIRRKYLLLGGLLLLGYCIAYKIMGKVYHSFLLLKSRISHFPHKYDFGMPCVCGCCTDCTLPHRAAKTVPPPRMLFFTVTAALFCAI